MTDGLVQFLNDRLDEDERMANAASPGPWEWTGETGFGEWVLMPADHQAEPVVAPFPDMTIGNGAHIVRHDPARVLAEVDAKRRLIREYEQATEFYDQNRHAPAGEAHGLRTALLLLALPYNTHPDYQPEWAPED